MAAIQPGMNFYGQMPDSYSLAVNTDHPLIRKISEEAGASLDARIEPLENRLTTTTRGLQPCAATMPLTRRKPKPTNS